MTNIHCNAGFVHVTHNETLPGYILVCFNKDSITNILSMENTTKKYPISYDSSAGDKFILQESNKQLVFNRSPSGLYFHDAGARDILMVTITN